MASEIPIHVILLTRDRPIILCRCVAQMVLHSSDRITILDDSAEPLFNEGQRLLSGLHTRSLNHLSADQVFSHLKSVLPENAQSWMNRTAPRDIAPLRNLSLLISLYTGSKLTIFVDDDITGIDLQKTRLTVEALARDNGFVIAGASLAGTDERGIIERLELALNVIKGSSASIRSLEPEVFFQMPDQPRSQSPEPCQYVSGGYIAFTSPNSGRPPFAFPPGYNEDWIWCIENCRHRKAKVFRLPLTVIHDPHQVRMMTHEDVKFELLGDLTFELILQNHLSLLNGFAEESITPAYLDPHVRQCLRSNTEVRNLINRAHGSRCRQILFDAGVTALQALFGNGFQVAEWVCHVDQWICDAKDKQGSFSRALSSQGTQFLDYFHKQRG